MQPDVHKYLHTHKEVFMDKKEFIFGWGDRKFTEDEIKILLEKVVEFNAGAIDEYLTNHVHRAFDEWKKELDQ